MKIDETLKVEPIVEEKIFSVSEFLDYLNKILTPHWAIVQGEVGEKIDKYPNYTFFNLLDKNSSILKCFAWNEVIEVLGITLEGGMEIKVIGYPEIRKERGELKFQVKRIELVGEGILKKQFEILKKKLTALGYFAPEIKKEIQRFCENIGLITSKYGKGAKKDFETHLGKFGFRIFFYDVRVEGPFALQEIIEAINYFNQNFPNLDVLVLTRGGGDWESLQPFNSEEIVKAIRASRIPIITGIGHEDDTTLADLAADLRASTPTHAARILNENWKAARINISKFEKNLNVLVKRIFENFKERITFYKDDLTRKTKEEILLKKKALEDTMRNLNISFQNYFKEFKILEKEFKKNFSKIARLIKNQKLKIDELLKELIENKERWKEKIEKILRQQEEKLILSSPILKLKQGYTITSDEFGKIIKDPTKLKITQLIKTKFYKGQVLSKVKKIEK
ncbi:MAG: exodeoxyribonuclease VII large subunit [Candidatus Aenigmatarchaeota archaeon]